ncbi:alpha-mannosyltransferase [Pedobacter psychroterrae]|uniref:Alpha 1,2-mannosyltransferase n=1 Tax=Pedobacter psychroterrae TaxID=2530453 RepID=A0A4R0NKX9_9SPHI|nr:hypothetical protein [Pedobacter psychroterrae]TCD01256.1 hypothetical protein EZ437_10905 [Pedobacter psychroterrae]
MKFNEDGVREIPFVLDTSAISKIRLMLDDCTKTIPDYPQNFFSGKGIVICAGGISYLTCAWILINRLKEVKCKLPVELWFRSGELSQLSIQTFKSLGIECRMFDSQSIENLDGVGLKPLAIKLSKFKEILYLDADNFCLKDPSYLFDYEKYKEFGAVFWPDYWRTAKDNPIWQIVDNYQYNDFEQESGQIMINKEICWKELNLTIYMNKEKRIFYQLLLGDKDTFKFSWNFLKSKFQMIGFDAGSCGFICSKEGFIGKTMTQHDPNGNLLFLHRNLGKWNVNDSSQIIWKFLLNFQDSSLDRKYFLCENDKHGKHMKFGGNFKTKLLPKGFLTIEPACLANLAVLASMPFFQEELRSAKVRLSPKT